MKKSANEYLDTGKSWNGYRLHISVGGTQKIFIGTCTMYDLTENFTSSYNFTKYEVNYACEAKIYSTAVIALINSSNRKYMTGPILLDHWGVCQ